MACKEHKKESGTQRGHESARDISGQKQESDQSCEARARAVCNLADSGVGPMSSQGGTSPCDYHQSNEDHGMRTLRMNRGCDV